MAVDAAAKRGVQKRIALALLAKEVSAVAHIAAAIKGTEENYAITVAMTVDASLTAQAPIATGALSKTVEAANAAAAAMRTGHGTAPTSTATALIGEENALIKASAEIRKIGMEKAKALYGVPAHDYPTRKVQETSIVQGEGQTEEVVLSITPL